MGNFTNEKGKELDRWKVFSSFTGLQTKADPTKVDDGASVNGQNTTVNSGDRISVRDLGYSVFPAGNTDNTQEPITSNHVFRKRSGQNIIMRSHGTVLEYYNPISSSFISLGNKYTSGKSFGYADYNINTDLHSYVYFCNAYEDLSRWTGAFSPIVSLSAGANLISGIALNFGGSGYSVGDVLNIAGGTGGQVTVNSLSDRAVTSVSIANAGTGYQVGDILQVGSPATFENGSCKVKVLTINGGGGITSVSIVNQGHAYVASSLSWSPLVGGHGTTGQLYVTAVSNTSVSSITLTNNGSGYTATTGVATSYAGAGTGLLIDITSVETYSIQVADASDFTSMSNNTNVKGALIINGNWYSYTKVIGNFLCGINVDPTGIGANVGDMVTQGPDTFPNNPKGNILAIFTNRLFVSGINNVNQAVYFSYYGDATSFVNASLILNNISTAPGIFNLGEGGGAVTGMAMDEKNLYIFKRSIIYAVTLTDANYSISPLKAFDGKSQTTGAIGSNSCFSGGNGVFFITPDKQICEVSRLSQFDYPQASSISEPIKPTVANIDFTSAAGIVFGDRAYISCKSSVGIANNDTVLVWDIVNKFWENPIIGWQVSDWFVYNNGSTEDLYFSDSVSINSYKVNSTPSDNSFNVTASWKSKRFHFGAPQLLKQMEDVFIDGYISANTSITVNLYYNENGVTKLFSTVLDGSNTDYLFNSLSENPFGLTKFGTERFGSNPDASGRVPFRAYLGKEFPVIPFYNAQIEFISDGDNQQWEIENFAFKIGIYTVPTQLSLYKAFK